MQKEGYNKITKNTDAVKKCGPDAELVDERGEAKGNNGKGKAKPIVSPQKPWISY